MRRAERTYVATAFVPFRRRRVDAVAARLVSELRALGIDAERLRLPVTMTEQGAAGSAAAASLVNLSWAHNVICLEFPCLHVVADRMSAFRVRGGLDDHLLRHDVVTRTPASRFAPDLVEPGATAGWSSAPVCMPPGLLSIDLRDRGMLDSTLVVVAGEFGRTPRINQNQGIPGRQHWPHCYSAILAGGGIRGGAVYGESDKIGAYVKDSPVRPQDFSATIYHALGVPFESQVTKEGVSKPLSTGQPILKLFG